MSYHAEIIKALQKLGRNGVKNPDEKHNVGRSLGEYFFWKVVADYAEKQKARSMDEMVKEGIAPLRATLEPGDHHFADSPNFVGIAQVTKPVRTFSGDELAFLLKSSKYKVPEPVTKEMIEAAKLPGKPRVTFQITERS